MEQLSENSFLFRHGSTWLRGDFHLHTRADAEFKYSGDHHFFVSEYVEQLRNENIRVAVITNHNKFDLLEFKSLRKNADRENIYLLPGVELSVTGGARGLHILIVFDDAWIFNKENHNYIKDFIAAVFAGKTGYDRPPYNQNTNTDFSATCLQLDKFDKDYFIILAHIEDTSGLFEELDGRGLREFMNADCFKKYVLACQKARNRDKCRSLEPMALVEGSDSAENGIPGIGKGNEVGGVSQVTYLKLGAFNFPALKFALRYFNLRIKKDLPKMPRCWIKQLTINPDKEDSILIPFNGGLNTLIGIRGGGKSSILEAIRFVLESPLPDDPLRKEDREYKERIVQRLIGNGGEVSMDLADENGAICYSIKKSVSGRKAEIFDGSGNPLPERSPSDIIQVVYFGQKDLEYAGQRFDGNFIENKLLQSELNPLKTDTQKVVEQVRHTLKRLNDLRDDVSTLEEVKTEIERLENLQNHYRKFDLQSKMEVITFYDTEEEYLLTVTEALNRYKNQWNLVLEETLEELSQLLRHTPRVEEELFIQKVFPPLEKVVKELEQWQKSTLPEEDNNLSAPFDAALALFNEQKEHKRTEFEAVKREINDPNINVETFREVERKLRANRQKQRILEEKARIYDSLREILGQQLQNLKNCWQKEFEVVRDVLNHFNQSSESIKITAEFMGDRSAFAEQLKLWGRGSNLKASHYENICGFYSSGIDLYNDLYRDNSKLYEALKGGNLLGKFQECLLNYEGELIIWRTPDKFEFLYRNRPLSEYSLGQRATALTAFILAQQQKDLFLIDQPEDDLDNQTVARELIQQILKTKQSTQYILVTHNPNIVVLGDSDQVIECQFLGEHFSLNVAAGIDDKRVQESVINIMEGGEDALKTRTQFYQISKSWKH